MKLVTCILLLAFIPSVLADEKVSFRTNLFSDNSGTTVQSPAVEIAKRVLGNLEFLMRYSLDRVIIPPIRGLAATPSPTDGITGASRPVDEDEPANESFTKDRNELNIGLALPGFRTSYYYSRESDYLGRMVTVAGDVDFNQRNTNVAASYSYGWDDIRPLGADTSHTKRSHSANLTLTQALSPKLIGRAGVDLSYADGFQSNPYRTVNAAGEILLENHPLQRTRAAVFLKLNRYFKTQTSLHMEYRFYRDDWQVQSHTMSFFYHQYFNDKVLIRYRYRYYQQSAAYFFRDTYPAVQQVMTSDYKLEKFNAHLFGFKIEYKLTDLLQDGFLSFMSNATFEAKYERYFTSNDFTADIFQLGLVLNY
ncbi:MAG: DUF3570 domain-containing protein [bacterium]